MIEWLTATSSLLLLIVTAIYVVLTGRIATASQRAADEARRAAEASVEQAEVTRQILEEARNERQAAVRPTITVENIDCSWRGERLVSFIASVRNVGPGIAITPSFTARLGPDTDAVTELPAISSLPVGERTAARFQFEDVNGSERTRRSTVLTIEAECLDIAGRHITFAQRLKLHAGRTAAFATGPPTVRQLQVGNLRIAEDGGTGRPPKRAGPNATAK